MRCQKHSEEFTEDIIEEAHDALIDIMNIPSVRNITSFLIYYFQNYSNL